MAYLDSDLSDIEFVNLHHRVNGKVDLGGGTEDLLAVQALLNIVYNGPVYLHSSEKRPIQGEVSVTGQPAKDTPILIAHFQRIYMKKVKPKGFMNPARGKGWATSTIYALCKVARLTLEARSKDNSVDLIATLRNAHPKLQPRLLPPYRPLPPPPPPPP